MLLLYVRIKEVVLSLQNSFNLQNHPGLRYTKILIVVSPHHTWAHYQFNTPRRQDCPAPSYPTPTQIRCASPHRA